VEMQTKVLVQMEEVGVNQKFNIDTGNWIDSKAMALEILTLLHRFS